MIFFHFLNIENLAKFNRIFFSKINQIYNSKFFFSISLLKNDEIFAGEEKKTVKQFTVFMKESAVLCTVI
jgi:hypothetical protein